MENKKKSTIIMALPGCGESISDGLGGDFRVDFGDRVNSGFRCPLLTELKLSKARRQPGNFPGL
jgi:hypothetical protein